MEEVEKLRECVKENLNKETQVQIRLFDNKNNRVAYKSLTLKELMMLEATGLNWRDLKKEKRKNE
ncbi:hypothetical protein [Clostridium beijerinckii]|uniref:hypothetical protein n=1 Tax=Clostridium beijerinckii TaxID=1520 RepID=UPI00136109EC|nr:hypothetical protein [Clostridium beijerinckii]MZK53335.1 hypothetical protein [Clostridium beijerinckii]MZK61440.1 hypothetical protein [Clostridium beijerinckii]MZK71682.1 hypothetical protein [Clostridium beijerinckii]MZK77075.1 hypothetical protein [Clostridium beijerinckii]MZK86730.1 hypothetical protein [Clostridium beijerinckii]